MSAAEATLNINVGVLGHVDSGKTSLGTLARQRSIALAACAHGSRAAVKALSTLLSTASLDKHPQSKQRGITLDLGFSAFVVDAPDHIRGAMRALPCAPRLPKCPPWGPQRLGMTRCNSPWWIAPATRP